MDTRSQKLTWGAGVLVLLAAALLYLLTLDTGLRPDELTGGDLITHQYAQVQARPSNAPGYPLYTMGGWLWFHAARPVAGLVFNPTQILSAYSTLWGLASLALLYWILLDVTRNRRPIAALLTAFHGVTFFFWYYSVTTEQYTSAVFQTLLLIGLAFRWDKNPRTSTLLWMAFVSGTMLANMVTTLFILPPLLWFVLFKPANGAPMLAGYLKRPKLLLAAIGAALLPLLSYAYIYIRGAQHPEWRGAGRWASAGDWFVDFLTIQQGRDELAPGLSLQQFFTAEFPGLMVQEMTWLVFFGGLLGLAFLGRRRAIFLYSTLVIYFVFSWGYRFGNWFQVIIPAYPIFTVGFAALLAEISDRSAAATPRGGWAGWLQKYTEPLIWLVPAGLLLFKLTTNLPAANQRYRPEDTGLAPGRALLADSPQPPAIIAADFGERVALEYLQTVWNAAPGITPVDATAAPPLVNASAGQTAYASRQAAAAAPQLVSEDGIHPQAAGKQLIALNSALQTDLPPTATPANVDFGGQFSLAGWEVVSPPANGSAPANWQIALYWRSGQPTADYTISVRPLVNGQMLFQNDQPLIQDHQPVWGLYPTTRWQPGEVVRDVYAPALPAGVTPDAVQVVAYRATDSGFENLADVTLALK